MYRPTLIALIISSMLLGCEFKLNDEQGFKSTDPEYMRNFMVLLDKRNVKYQYANGYIRYNIAAKPKVEEVERLLSSTKSIQFKNEEVRQYFHSLLDKEGIEYLLLRKDGGTWTMWWAGNEELEKAIQLEVTEFAFANNLPGNM